MESPPSEGAGSGAREDSDTLLQSNKAQDLIIISGLLGMADRLCQLIDFALHPLGQVHLRQSFRLEKRNQPAGEHRVGIRIAVGKTIESNLAQTSREQHEHALGRIDFRQALTGADTLPVRRGERIVAASIDDGKDRLRTPCQDAPGNGLDAIAVGRHEVFLSFLWFRQIDRQEIVFRAERNPMAGVVEENHIVLGHRIHEIVDLAQQFPALEICSRDDREAQIFVQCFRHRPRVVERLGERPQTLIILIADYQRDALGS